MFIKDYLDYERNGTGGILFIYTSSFAILVFIIIVTLMQVTTSRTVAESVEHTIALECLAACYLDPVDNGVNKDDEAGTTYNLEDRFLLNGKSFSPKQVFDDTMHSFGLMRPGGNSTKGYMIYKYNDNSDTAHVGKSTFELCFGGYPYNDNFWTQMIDITPNPQKVTIEKSYTSWK